MNQALYNPFDLISKGTGLKDFPITTACPAHVAFGYIVNLN